MDWIYWFIIISLIIISAWLLRKYYLDGPYFNKKRDLTGKTCIVTGSSSGIGKETAFDLLSNGASVIFACRDEQKTLAILNSIKNFEIRNRAIFLKLDLSNIDSIINFTKEFRKLNRNIDCLVNNAGFIAGSFHLNEGIESMLMCNYIGHKILTLLLLDKFSKDDARIVNLTSIAYDWSTYDVKELHRLQENLNFEGEGAKFEMFKQYGNSKLGMVLFTRYLVEKLAKDYPRVKISSNHPGNVITDVLRFLDDLNIIFKTLFQISYIFIYFCKSALAGAQNTLYYCYEDWEKLENGVYLCDLKSNKLSEKGTDQQIYNEFMKYSWLLVDKVTRDKVFVQRL